MKCTKCGKEIDDNAVFCQFCGSKIEKQQPSTVSNNDSNKSESKKKGSPVGKIILIIAIIAIAVLAIDSYQKEQRKKEALHAYSSYMSAVREAEAQQETDKMNFYKQRNKDLSISNSGISHNSSYTICEGSIKNNGSKSYEFIKVKGSFKNKSGEVVDTDWTYAIGGEGLGPGERTTFRLSIDKNTDVVECEITYTD